MPPLSNRQPQKNRVHFICLGLCVGGIALLALPAFAADAILSADFETDPLQSDWTTFGSGRIDGDLFWSNENPRSGKHYLLVHPSRRPTRIVGWESPPFKVSEGELYRLTFWARTADPAYWQISFQDFTGAVTEGDHNSQIEASDDWTFHEHFFRTKYPGATATAAFYTTGNKPLGVDDVRIEKASEAEALAAADRRWQAMSPPNQKTAPFAGKLLPKRNPNEPYRIVLTGDSIANDLSNSSFPLLFSQAFPGSTPDCRFTGKAGTGWMKLQSQIQQRILQHQPDLLILQAISNDEDWMEAPLERLIEECRTHSPKTEILLVTPHLKSWSHRSEEGALQRDRILKVGAAKQVNVFDLQTVWADYLNSTGRPLESLLRDGLHMNEFGRELSARALMEYLLTKRAQPSPTIGP